GGVGRHLQEVLQDERAADLWGGVRAVPRPVVAEDVLLPGPGVVVQAGGQRTALGAEPEPAVTGGHDGGGLPRLGGGRRYPVGVSHGRLPTWRRPGPLRRVPWRRPP